MIKGRVPGTYGRGEVIAECGDPAPYRAVLADGGFSL
jgi:hypothetical protein